MLQVRIYIVAGISCGGQAFGIAFPGFSGADQLPDDVIGAHGLLEAIVNRDDLPGGEHEVIADRGMNIGIVIRCSPYCEARLLRYGMEELP